MDGDVINIKIHHGGNFSKDGVLTYVGGQVSFYRNCDVDRLSYFELVGMVKEIGFSEGDKLYYTIPSYCLETGIDEIHNDQSVERLLKFRKPNMFIDIYIQHVDQHGISGKTKVGEASEDVNMDEKKRSKKQKTLISAKKRERKVWSAEEEKIFIDLLYDMNDSSWKVDTGHKTGYLAFIEKEMAKKLPNCELKADPHLKSKVKILKKQLNYVLDIQQNGSGFGWDDEQKMVTGDKDIFMEWAKSRDGAAPLYRKPMVHYDKLVEIYANDLAKGSKVKGPGDQSETEEDISTLNVAEGNVDESASQTRGTNTTPGTSKQSLKRKAGELDPLEIEFLQISKSITSLLEAEKESVLAMKDITKAFTHEINVHEETCDKRKSLFEVLCKLPGLSSDQVVKATRLIGQDIAKMDLFLAMPDDFKVIFAQQEIDGAN
ncbi:uncharacterized protein LOC104903051 [Beta vulgaris subsp. vulgaris]|uniref:uncharacterized protein LOC104903051 n=1 Tax=Beta vulgaris subsp. vulgaris TaxID=3555 RepID=UPI002036BA88|nr:uncharacterized protein LOC104903051 [Beta vulgaris subsp. vulgaris]